MRLILLICISLLFVPKSNGTDIKIIPYGARYMVYIPQLEKILFSSSSNGKTYLCDIKSGELTLMPDIPNTQVKLAGDFLMYAENNFIKTLSLPDFKIVEEIDMGQKVTSFQPHPKNRHFIIYNTSNKVYSYKNGQFFESFDSNPIGYPNEFEFSSTDSVFYYGSEQLSPLTVTRIRYNEDGSVQNSSKIRWHSEFQGMISKDGAWFENKKASGTTTAVFEELPDSTIFQKSLIAVSPYGYYSGILGSIIDTSKREVMQVHFDVANNELKTFTFDLDRKVFLYHENITNKFSGIDFSTLSQVRLISLNNGKDFAIGGPEMTIIVRECDNNVETPVLDSVYNKTIWLCENNQHIFYPPQGYSNFYINNRFHDSLIINEDTRFTIQVANQNGCLGMESNFIEFRKGTKPAKPQIAFQGNISTLCQNGYIEVRVSNPNTFDTYIWSNGEIGSTVLYTEKMKVWVKTKDYQSECYSDSSKHLNISTSQNIVGNPPEIIFLSAHPNICNNAAVEMIAPSNATYQMWRYSVNGELKQSFEKKISGFMEWARLRTVVNDCWTPYTEVQIGNYDIPEAPNLLYYIKEKLLFTEHGGSKYKWFVDDELIPEQELPVLQIVKKGSYRAQVFDGHCWSSKSTIKKIN